MRRYLLLLVLGSLGLIAMLAAGYALLDAPAASAADIVRARDLLETGNYLNAIETLRTIEDPGAAAGDARAYLGAAYLHLHLYRAALAEFESAARRSPGALDPWIGLAVVQIRLGNGREALENAQRAVRVAENSPEVWLVLGRVHWFGRDFGQAEKAGLKARELDPRNLQAVELLLQIYSEQNDAPKFRELLEKTETPDKAIRDLAIRFAVRQGEFRRAYELQQQFERRERGLRVLRAQLALARGDAGAGLSSRLIRDLVFLGRSGEALQMLRTHRGPDRLDMEMGKALVAAGDRAGALRAFTSAAADPQHRLSGEASLAAMTRDRRHWNEAFKAERIERDYFVLAGTEPLLNSESALEKAFAYRYAAIYEPAFFNNAAEAALSVLNAEPDNYEALMTLSTAYHRLGRVEDARRYVERARDRFPDLAEPWSRLGGLALTSGNASEALAAMERAARIEPSNPTYLYNLGWLLDQADQDAAAVPYYERAISASSLSFEAMNNLALLEAASGRTGSALKLLDRAVESNPEDEAAYLNRGNFSAGRGEWKEALVDYRRVQEFNPANVFAIVEAARMQLELGRTDAALADLNRALNIDPNTLDAYVLMAEAYRKLGRGHEAGAAEEEAGRLRPQTVPKEPE